MKIRSLGIMLLIILNSFVSFSQDATFSSPDATQCPDNLFTLNATNTTYGNSNYSWLITGPSGYSQTPTGSSVAVYLTVSGFYNVKLTVTVGGTPTSTTQDNFIQVYSKPTIDYSVTPTTGCSPLLVTFTSSCTPGPDSGTLSTFQANADGTSYSTEDFTHTFTSGGTFTPSVTVTNSVGCFTTGNLSPVTVTTSPSLTSPLNPNSICSGSTFNYTPTSTISGTTYSWVRTLPSGVTGSGSNTSTGTSGVINQTLTSATTQQVTYAMTATANGCSRTQNVLVTVRALPTVSITQGATLAICTGQTGTLTAAGLPSGGTYLWSTAATTASINVTTSGARSVTYSDGTCSSVAASSTVSITTPPVINNFTYTENSLTPNDRTICRGSSVVIGANITPSGGTYLWSTGATTSTISVSPTATVTYTLTYTQGCSVIGTTEQIIVLTLPVTGINPLNSNFCAQPATASFTNTSTNAGGGVVWSFLSGGGSPSTSTSNSPSVTYTTAGSWSVTLTATSTAGCVKATTYPNAVTIGSGTPPTSLFNVTTPLEQCYSTVAAPSNTVATNSVCFQYSGTGADTIQVDWGDGSPLQLFDETVTFCRTYQIADTFNVEITPYSTIGSSLGCDGTPVNYTVIINGPVASFTTSAINCLDQKNRTFTSTSTGLTGSSSLLWDFGDPASGPNNTSTSPVQAHTFVDPSVFQYTVRLTATDASSICPTSAISTVISVFTYGDANFQAYNNNNINILNRVVTTDVCIGGQLCFFNETPLPQYGTQSSNSLNTRWDYNTNDGFSIPANPGSAVRGTPKCNIFDTVTNAAGFVYTIGTFGVGMIHIDPNGCRDTVIKPNYISVHGLVKNLVAADEVCSGIPYTPVDNSTAPLSSISSRIWNWGDGTPNTTGNVANPSHIYANTGTYTITLTITDNSGLGCSAVITKQVIVRKPTASFSVDRNFICSGQTVTVTNNSIGIGLTSYDWIATTPTTVIATGTSPSPFTFSASGSINLTVRDNLGCIDDSTISITVQDPIPSATASPSSVSCFNPPTNVTFTNTSTNNVDNTSAVWNFNSTNINGGTGTSPLTSNNWQPSVTYSLPGTYIVTLQVSSLTGCTSTVQQVATVTIGGPSGTVSVTNSNLTGCSCYTANMTVTTANVTEAKLLYGDGQFLDLTPNTTQNVSYSYCNTGATTITRTPSLYISNGTCNGFISALQTINIKPTPTVTAIPNQLKCAGVNSDAVTFTGNVPTATYTWSRTNTNISATALALSGTGNIASFLTDNTLSTSVSSVFTVTPSYDGCTGSPINFTITVGPRPVSTVSTTTVCVGGTVTTTPNTGGTWTSTNPTAASITSSGIVSVGTSSTTQTTTLRYTETSSGCFRDHSLTVNPRPIVTASSLSVCVGNTINLSPNSGGTWTSSAPSIASVVSGTGVVTGVAAGTANFTYTVTATGCSNTTSNVTVNPLPVVTLNPTTICQGQGATATPSTLGTWSVVTGTGVSITNGGIITSTTSATGPASFKYRITATGCEATTGNLTINVLPTLTASTSICFGSIGNLTPSTGGTWVSNNTSRATVSSSGIVTPVAPVNPGTVNFTFTQTSTGCSNTTSNVIINNVPAVTAPSSICFGATGNLTPTTGGSWVSNTPTRATVNSTSGVITPATPVNPGNVTFTFTNTSTGCSSTTSNVTINALPIVTAASTSICIDGTTTLTPITGGTWASAFPLIASVTNAGLVTGLSAGSATMTFTNSTTGCSSATSPITVNALPTFGLTKTDPTLCNATNGTVTITGLNPSVSYRYTYVLLGNSTGPVTTTSNGSGQITVSNLGAGTYTFSIELVSTGCQSATQNVTLVNPNAPDLDDIADQFLCGTTTYILPPITGSNLPGNQRYYTLPGGTGTSYNAGDTYTGILGSTQTLYIWTQTPTTGGCSDQESFTITFSPNPTIIAPSSLCVGSTAQLTPSSNVTWISNLPSRATVTNAGVLTGVAPGNVTITVEDNTTQCSSTAVVNIVAIPTVNSPTFVCVNGTINLTPATGGTWAVVAPGSSFASVTSAGVVTGIAPGTVQFIFTNSTTTCTNTTSNVTVRPQPILSSPAPVCMGSTGLLSPTIGGTWTSLATGIATVTNAGVITPVAPGNVTFRFLEASSSCSDTTLNVVINALPVLGGPNQVCVGSNINLTPSIGGTWSGGNPTIATISPSGVVNGDQVGSTSFTFTSAVSGCTNTSSTITVNPNPVLNGPSQVCVGSTISYAGGTGFQWTSTDPSILTVNLNTGVVTGVAAGQTTIINTNPTTQCFAISQPITVNALPVVSAPASVCVGGNVTLSPTSGGTWATSDGTKASVSNNGVVTGVAPGTGIIFTYTQDIINCANTTTALNVIANPVITLTPTNPTICNAIDGTIRINGLTANTSFQYSYNSTPTGLVGPITATSNASGQITISGLAAGTYTVTVTNLVTTCISAEVITTLNNPNAPNITDIADQTLCGGTYTLPAITGTNLTNPGYFNGPGGTGGTPPTIITASGPTIIYMYSATPGGCSDEESFSITINTVPTVSSPANVCVGETVTLSPTSGGSWAVFSGPTFASVQDDGTVLGLLSGSASFIWTESGTNCTNTTTPITVKAVNTVDAGTAQTVCSNTTVTLAGTMGGSATSSNWSGGSGFSSTASLTPTYTLDPAEIGAGSATLTLTAIDPTGICPNVSDQVIITIDQAPVVNAGTNDIFCSSETYQLSASIGGLATNVTWTKTGTSSAASTLSSTSVLNPIYTPSPTDVLQQPIVFTATTNDPLGPCLASTSQVTIAISPRVVVNAGNDFVSCADTQVQLNGSITGSITSGTWSGGAGVFTSSANSLTAQYQPTVAELTQPNIILILTSDDPVGPCPAILDSVIISFAQPAIVDAGPDQTICSGVMISQTGSFGGAATSITWASTTMPIIARGTITNSPNALTINYMPSSTEINNLYVDLEIYSNDPAGPCGIERDTVRITINPTPFLLNNTIFSHCSGNALNIPLTVQNNLSSDFVWEMLDNPNISGEPVGLIYTSAITNTLVNNTLIDQIVIINVTPIIAGCIGSPVQLTVTVHPRPTMDPVSNQTLCSLTPTTAVVFNSNISGTTYSWTNDLTSTNIGIGGNGSGNIPVFTPPGFTTTSIANIVVTPEYSGCEGIPVLFSYTFLPVSTVNDPSDIVVCHNQTVPSTIFTGNNPNTVYNWQNSETSIGLISIGQDDISSFIGNNPPPSSLPVISTLTVTPQLNTCFGVPQTFTITVKPIPVLQSINDRRLCIGNISNTIAFPAAPSGTTFAWTNSLPAIGLSAGGTTNFIPSFTATHTTGVTVNQVDTGYINVIPTFNGCAGLPVNFLIMVNPVLQADPIPDMVFCEGEVFPEIIITGNAPDVNYTWSYNNIATGLAPTGTNVIPSHIVQSGNFGEFGNVTIIPTHPSLPNCLGTQTSFSITVKPKPNVYVSQPVQGACHNVATTAVNFTSDVPNTTFSWQNTNNMSIQVNSILNGISTNSGNLPSFIGHNTTIAPVSQTANYNVFTFSNGCVGDTATFSITVDPKPTVLPENDQTLCAGQTTLPVTFTGNFGGSTTYNWSTNNVSIFPSSVTVPSTNSIPSFNAQNSTSVTQIAEIICVPIFGFCVGDTTKFEFIIKPKPTVNAVPDQSLCSGSLTSLVQFFGNMDVTPSDGAATYNWTNDNISINLVSAGTGNIIPFIAGNTGSTVVTATITVVPEINNCIGDTMTFTITTVDPIPLVDVLTNIELCAGETTNAICFTGANPVTSFNWTATNGSLIGLSNSGSANSTSGFCIDPFVTTNGSSITDIIATFTVSPVYSGCVGTPRTFDIKVKPVPNVFVTPITQTVCANTITQDVLFTGNIPGTSFGWIGSLYNIGINDVGTSDILSFTALNSTNFDLIDTILVTPTFNGCTGIRDTAFIIVNPISDVNIAIDSFSYCHGDNVPQNCFVGNNLNTVYTWSNDNTAIGLASAGTGCIPSFVAQNTSLQNDTALIIVQPMLNGCLGIPDTIMIYTKPIPNVYSIPDINVCAGVTVPTITFQGDMTNETDFVWSGNTPIGLSPNSGIDVIPTFVGFNNSQVILVNSIITRPQRQGCFGARDTLLISVNPISEVTIVDSLVFCNGVVVPPTVINGTSPIAVYAWTNNNISIGLSAADTSFTAPHSLPSFTAVGGVVPQIAQIVVTPLVNGCPGVNDTMIITVNPTPIVNPVPSQSLCAGTNSTPIIFTGPVANTTYNWEHFNASTGLVPTSGVDSIPIFEGGPNLYPSLDNVATVQVIPEADGCLGDTIFFTFTVHPLPIINAGFDTTLCLGQFIIPQGSGLSIAGLSFGFQWTATPGNTIGSTPLNGQPYYPDATTTLSVIGTDMNLCQNVDTLIVNYLQVTSPQVFAGLDTAICFGESITLCAVHDGDLLVWDNGVFDCVEFIPLITNTYIATASHLNGCYSKDTVVVTVNSLPIITANASDDFICDGDMTILWGDGAGIGAVYTWDNSVIDSVGFIPLVTNTYTVIGTDVNGCKDTADIVVTVNPNPIVLFSSNITFGGCLPFAPVFTDLTSPTSGSVTWDFGDGNTDNQLGNVVNIYDNYGCYDVTLTSTTPEGCTATLTQQDFVCVNEIIADFYPDSFEQPISNPTFEFTNTSQNATSYEWFFGDLPPSISTAVHPDHTYGDIGFYAVTLVASAQDGCTDTAVIVIKVRDEVLFYVPNSFTPDDNGLNDVFLPVLTAGYDRTGGWQFKIYNRWGEEIFNSDIVGNGWDGTYQGELVQFGTYVWTIRFKDSQSNKIYDFTGHVNLIR